MGREAHKGDDVGEGHKGVAVDIELLKEDRNRVVRRSTVRPIQPSASCWRRAEAERGRTGER